MQADSPKTAPLPEPYWEDQYASVYFLPEDGAQWQTEEALRAVFEMLRQDRANAVLRPLGNGNYEVSVQASNGGSRSPSRCVWRINKLPATEVDHLIDAFSACRWGELRSPVFRAWK